MEKELLNEVYDEAFEIGKKFKNHDIRTLLLRITSNCLNFYEKFSYILEFIIMNDVDMPESLMKILKSNEKDREKLILSFAAGLQSSVSENK